MITKKAKIDQKLLHTGDILKTHPRDGYWGCAIVLSQCDGYDGTDHPMCHIAITPLVFDYDYDVNTISKSEFNILISNQSIRVAPNQYVPLRQALCIGIYSRKINRNVHIISNTDISHIIPTKLEFTAGDGTDGGWPFCGPVLSSLGYEAIVEWRKIYDAKKFYEEFSLANESFEKLLLREKEISREKRIKKQNEKNSK